LEKTMRETAPTVRAVRVTATACVLALASLALAEGAGAQALEAAAGGYQQIQVERRGPVVIGRFNNPPRQVMDPVTVHELSNLLAHVERDADVRVLILTGADPNFFIAHYDLGTSGASPPPVTDPVQRDVVAALAFPQELHGMNRALLQMEATSKPVLCAINGQAHGGGFETALACDFRFMSTSATVGLIETRARIIPGGGGTQRLPRLVGPAVARQHIYFGTPVDAETALSLGMVDGVFAPDQLLDGTLAFADRLAQMTPHALAEAKRAINAGLQLPLIDGLLVEQEGFFRTMQRRAQ
jgi:enoyl-CoA hydratase/carnithine racemase